ncbi:MAG: nucleotidyltransferase domain-containing protein [Desulfuromonadales bacterium]|nr:nucleotidyltransferase domain-containing protein [Desulfuromonadales bacterium]
MGTIRENSPGIGGALFTKTQRQVLGLLFGNPGRTYYLNEIVRKAEVGIGTVQRELEKLTAAGLLTVKKVGNQKHYQADSRSPIFQELRGIVLKTFGVADELRQALEPFSSKITIAFVYGSIARGADTASSDIDIMIISEGLGYPEVIDAFTEAETRLGRPINPTLYSPAEIRRKLAEDNSFLKRVTGQEKIFLIGSDDDIPKL